MDTDALLQECRESLADEWSVPAKIFNDQDIFDLERTQIFGRAWILLAHASEIPTAGDYVLRYIMEDPFIVVRAEDGSVQAHFNACRHRGMAVCRAEMGNASHFRCPYHGWTYRNTGDLIGVPAGREAYGDHLDKKSWSLRSIPQLAEYKGLIFGTLDPEAPPLEDFLGDMRFYLDIVVDRTDGGLEVVGAPQRWIVDSNWKLGSDNFIGDAYHTLMTHRSMVELGLAPPDPMFARYGEHIYAGNGHGLGLIGAPPDLPLPPYLGLPDEIVEQAQRRLDPLKAEVLRRSNFLHGTVFPNFSILNVWIAKDHLSTPVPLLTFRVWQPVAPGKMEIWSWFLVEKDGPDWYRQESYESYVRTFGTSGVFEQDDTENWRSITRSLAGQFAAGQRLNYQMGRGTLSRDDAWPGPGDAFPLDYAEFNQRAFYARWVDYMAHQGAGGPSLSPTTGGTAGATGETTVVGS